ncbi:MAG TPA: hypothetical protein VKB36_25950, partial [Vicinamibacterales bacterium]|nr:hypothetical protein [Vicinamibacterales bacterium]
MAQKNKDPEKPEQIDRSRRNFLKTAGAVSTVPLVAGIAGAAVADAQTGAAVVGPGDVPIQLMVNGKRLNLNIEPRMTLLNALR